jgi:SSS family solute:Na+ symporter
VNLLFLTLGAMLYIFAAQKNISIPKQTDDLLPIIALHYLSPVAAFCFMIGLISALYPSADGALTALTTSFCVDILDLQERKNWDDNKRKQIRYLVHFSFAMLLLGCVLIFNLINDKAVISTLFTIASYTYGPLLGFYAFGLFTKRKIADAWSPIVCLIAPVICYFLNDNSKTWFHGYQFGFELLVVNGLLTFAGLYLISKPRAATA